MRRPSWLIRHFSAAVVVVWLALTIEGGACAWLAAPQNAADTPASHHAAGMADLQAGRVAEALKEFRSALRLDRDYLPSLVEMADLLSSSGRVFEAYGVLQHAATVAPASAEVHALLGFCFFRMENCRKRGMSCGALWRSIPS